MADAVIKSGWRNEIAEVVSGGARGVDKAGELWAASVDLPVVQFLPDWDKLGKRAGLVRNIQMAEYAEALIAVWDESSTGTLHMINSAKVRGLKVFVYPVKSTLGRF